MRTILAFVAIAAAALPACPGFAQVAVDPNHKFAWAENCGWLNFRDADGHPGGTGVRLHATFLSGFVWGENCGWINLGDGTPGAGPSYGNTDGADSGVNRDPATNMLSGFAWGENIGWVNFGGGALASPPNPARYDPVGQRLRGFAWGENVGWINLDDAAAYVGFNACRADFNRLNGVTVQDIYDFLSDWNSQVLGGPVIVGSADYNGVDGITVQDLYDFLADWSRGCP